MSKTVDYIIVGQGIAGSCLAYRLINDGFTVLVFDKLNTSSSSRVASGIINPVTGRKLVKSWLADDLIPSATSFYKEIESKFSVQIFHETPIYKVFSSVAEQNSWFERSEEQGYHSYLKDIKYPNWKSLETPFGVGEIKNGAWVDTNLFLDTMRKWLLSVDALIEATFDYSLLDLNDGVCFNNIFAEKIIFCEGPAAIHNPYFKYLPFNLAKGEVMRIKSQTLEDVDGLISKNGFILPFGDGTFNVGATFKWNDYETTISEEGLEALTEKWHKISKAEFELIEQKAGIRPTVKDRRPFIGEHPYHKEVKIFNGLGTKGFSLAPYFSNHFIQYLEYGETLMREVNVERYEDLLTRP